MCETLPRLGAAGGIHGMRILLSTPPGETTDLWPPLGLMYIAASVRVSRSDEIAVVDAFCEGLTTRALTRRVVTWKPDVFGINCSTHTFLNAIEALRQIHELLPDTVLVMGGIHPTFAAELILREYPFVDFVVKGEGEEAFPQLLECIANGVKPSEVAGISYMDGGRYVSAPNALVQDLDALPLPARDLAQEVEYGQFHRGIRLTYGKFATISSSRGCPYECTYCSCAAFSMRRWRARSAENVVEEIARLSDDGYELCVFVDDTFTLNRRRVEKICDLIRSRGIRMRFSCEGRVDQAPYSLLRKMRLAGFDVMYFGVESACQHVLDYYRKRISPEQSTKAVENAKRAGMMVITSMIVGAPVESMEDILKSIEFVRAARPHGVQFTILDCLPGTPLWDGFIREGVVGPSDWKRNHRIYEYNPSGLSRIELEKLVNLGYARYLDGWKTIRGLREVLRVASFNRTARDVILRNFLKPHAIRWVARGDDDGPESHILQVGTR